jgi:hypothetical protein
MEDQVNQMEFAVQARLYTFDDNFRQSHYGHHHFHCYRAKIQFTNNVSHCTTGLGSPIYSIGSNLNHPRTPQHSPLYQIPKSLQLATVRFWTKTICRNGNCPGGCHHLTKANSNTTTDDYDGDTYLPNHERIHGILQTFVDKTLNTTAEEKKQASGLTKQQEQL